MRAIIRFALFLIAASGSVAAAQSSPVTMFTQSAELAGARVDVDIYVSEHAVPEGVAILAHGFARSRMRHRELARALAAEGFIAVVPDLPDLVSAGKNADAIVALARNLEAGEAGVPAVPRERLVLVGTSFGGLVTAIAATRLPGLAGWVGLDPVDRGRTALDAVSKLDAPAIVLLAEPSLCNLHGGGGKIARAAPVLLRSIVVQGASHCDFEGPTDSLCRVACGRGSNAAQTVARQEAVRAVADLLRTAERSEPRVARDLAD